MVLVVTSGRFALLTVDISLSISIIYIHAGHGCGWTIVRTIGNVIRHNYPRELRVVRFYIIHFDLAPAKKQSPVVYIPVMSYGVFRAIEPPGLGVCRVYASTCSGLTEGCFVRYTGAICYLRYERVLGRTNCGSKSRPKESHVLNFTSTHVRFFLPPAHRFLVSLKVCRINQYDVLPSEMLPAGRCAFLSAAGSNRTGNGERDL